MSLFPLFANLQDRPVLVVGGGEVASRKIEGLLRAGAKVRVHAHELAAELQQWLQQGRLQRLEGAFDPAWIDDAWLVVAATDDAAFNRQLAHEAEQRLRMINVVDDAALSSYQLPSVVDRGALQIAVSSGGAAPMLARQLREQLEAQLDHSLADFADLFARHRAAIRARLPDLARRRQWFEHVLQGPMQAMLAAGRTAQAEEAFLEALHNHQQLTRREGRVVVIPIRDPDPGLLTLKALRALNQADALLVDAGIAEPIQLLARRDAHRLPVLSDRQALAARMSQQAQSGDCVVYLHDAAADPGDSRELITRLAATGVPLQVLPAVTPWRDPPVAGP
ncbi:NAD(P)-dependent oxidoreductase [Pseudoxanthomonas dokdonensis]|uniref:precorrin-2 dehydrogenase n=1 Tax=Pseudoxanthomonas dokdonensis TaxID=344882 RepID=A0A0R0D2D9_9GAMM|nr:NAD(P)-dependent oxidoreductase [Pseudoxanthomonas dokdonensis]KRG71528.1 siroheme synthase [Pseudoxanthomonas dokdonensis]